MKLIATTLTLAVLAATSSVAAERKPECEWPYILKKTLFTTSCVRLDKNGKVIDRKAAVRPDKPDKPGKPDKGNKCGGGNCGVGLGKGGGNGTSNEGGGKGPGGNGNSPGGNPGGQGGNSGNNGNGGNGGGPKK